jgi:hypothetical protein
VRAVKVVLVRVAAGLAAASLLAVGGAGVACLSHHEPAADGSAPTSARDRAPEGSLRIDEPDPAADRRSDRGPSAGGAPVPAEAGSEASPAKPDRGPHAMDANLLAAHAKGGSIPLAGTMKVPLDPPPLGILLVSAHSAGWVTPCGCPGIQAGGIARRAGLGELLRKTFPTAPVRYFDLGGFLSFGGQVQRTTTEALLEGMNRIGYEASNAGIADFGRTWEDAEFVRTKVKIPRFSANVVFHDSGRPAYPPYWIVTLPATGGSDAPVRVGVIGVQDERRNLFAFGENGRSVRTIPVAQALERHLPELEAKTDVVVLLAEMTPEPLGALLKRFPGIGCVVAGDGGQFFTTPRIIENVPVVAVGNQGKYLAELRITRAGGKPAVVPFVHWLDETVPEDAPLARFAEESVDTINEISKRELQASGAQGWDIAPYAGSESCGSCHQAAADVWSRSRHAHAFQTLVKLKRDFTVSCVACHVTGHGAEEGGFANTVESPQLLNVQCEQCHGPARQHLEDPSAPYGKVTQNACLACHTPATDPTFAYEARWKTIQH